MPSKNSTHKYQTMHKKVFLLTNLGSPNSTNSKDVRTYLEEFLMDERVIDIPNWIRKILVKGIIIPFRAPKSAKKYKTIWTTEGSPLVVTTEKLCKSVEINSGIPTYFCMRYANPTPQEVLKRIHLDHPNLEQIVLLPLYPHYAMSSYETAIQHVQKYHFSGSYSSKITIVPPFYQHPKYISALSNSIQPYLNNSFDHLLFSFHGIPERHVKKTDPTKNHCFFESECCSKLSEAHAFCYRHQIVETMNKVGNTLRIPSEKYSFSFQSRLGRDQWLKPYTSQELKEMPKRGIKNLLVVCPAFVSDCLETLEEIKVEGREIFLEAGGENFTFIPCLNLQTEWIETVISLAKEG
jgi:ferrochelatase